MLPNAQNAKTTLKLKIMLALILPPPNTDHVKPPTEQLMPIVLLVMMLKTESENPLLPPPLLPTPENASAKMDLVPTQKKSLIKFSFAKLVELVSRLATKMENH